MIVIVVVILVLLFCPLAPSWRAASGFGRGAKGLCTDRTERKLCDGLKGQIIKAHGAER